MFVEVVQRDSAVVRALTAGTHRIEPVKLGAPVDDPEHEASGLDIAVERSIPVRGLERVQAVRFERSEFFGCFVFLSLQGAGDDAMHGALVRIPELVGDLLVCHSGETEFDAFGATSIGEGGVRVLSGDRGDVDQVRCHIAQGISSFRI